MKNFKKIIGYFFTPGKNDFLKTKLMGVDVRVINGTIRKTVDQDDAWFFYLAKNSNTIFDIGSNIGYMSLLAAIQPQISQILLADPNPEALSKAAQNIIVNGFGYKAKFISAFVGDKDGERIKFYTVGSGEAGSIFKGHSETAAALNSFYMVDQITIDTLVEKVNYIPDLIKIDVEGAESFALKGAIKTAGYSKSKFMIEMHSPPELTMAENGDRVLKWCNDTNYCAYYMKEGSKLENSDPIKQRGKCHLLLLPKNETYPVYLKDVIQNSPLPDSII